MPKKHDIALKADLEPILRTYNDDDDIELMLVEGSVSFDIDSPKYSGEILMSPSDMVRFDRRSGQIERSRFLPENYHSWAHDGSIYFFNESLDNITTQLSRRFNRQIVITDPKLLSLKFHVFLSNDRTLEDVLEICRVEKPSGVIVQYGGQTPLKICRALEAEGVPIIGTSTDAIDCAEDRERFQKLINELGLRQPPNRTCHTEEAALKAAEEIGYPIVVRPSYVLGGRAMDIVHNAKELMQYMHEAIVVSEDSPVLLDHFLDDAVEMDVDAVSDGNEVRIGGLMQHVEAAGVHSGDSACSLPPYSLREDILKEVRRQTKLMAKALNVVGLMNVQFAVKNAVTENPIVYVLEVNPRASRTVPFVSKATGEPLAKIAARCMVGKTFEQQGARVEVAPQHICVKEAVFPFAKFLGVDPVLGPEMRSTGEVMGVGRTFGEALFKSQLGSGSVLPPSGTVFISVRDEDKPKAIVVASKLLDNGYQLVATRGTAAAFARAGIDCRVVNKVSDGRPNIIDKIKNQEVQLVITTSNESRGEISDAREIRMAALANRVTYYTTIAGGSAAVEGIKHLKDAQVYSLQEMHKDAL